MASVRKNGTKAAGKAVTKTIPAAEVNKVAEEKKEVVKAPVQVEKKETPVKKERAKKAPAKAEVKSNVYVQYCGKEFSTEELVKDAKKAYIMAGHKEEDIKSIDVYVKPEENVAYYAVNGNGSENDKIIL